MSQGLKTQSERILQIIPEGINTPGVLNAAATPVLFSNGDHDWSVDNTYDNLRAAGYNVDEYNVVIEQMSGASFDFVPYYNLIDDQLLQFLMEVPSGANDATAGGARTRNWYFKQSGRTNRRTFTAEEGVAESARRAGYGLVPAASLTSERGNGGKTRGKMTMIMQAPVEGVAMTGQTAQSEAHRLVNNGAAGNATIYGTVAVAPGAAAATVETAIRAKNGIYANAVVAGSNISAGSAIDFSTNKVPTAVTAGPITAAFNNPADMFKPGTPTMTTSGGATAAALIDNGAPIVCTSVGVGSQAGTNANVNMYGTNNVDGYTGRVLLNTFPPANDFVVTKPSLSNEAFRYFVTEKTAGGGIYSVDFFGPNSSSGTYDISGFPANMNVADIEAAPGTGWVGTVTQAGSNGVVSPVTPFPITPDHWKVYRAATLANLGNAASFVGTVEKLGIDFAGLVEPHFSKDRSKTYNSHVDGGRDKLKIGASITMPTDEDGHCRAMQDGALAYLSTPQWIRFEAVSPVAPYKLVIDMYVSVGESVPYEYNGNIEERRFPLTLLRNSADGFCLRVTTVVAA